MSKSMSPASDGPTDGPLVMSPPRSGGRLAVAIRAAGFRLEDVRLLGGPFKAAQETDRKYLLGLDPDRLLAGMLRTSGLKPKGASYGGWEHGGSGIIGHYLSACAQMSIEYQRCCRARRQSPEFVGKHLDRVQSPVAPFAFIFFRISYLG